MEQGLKDLCRELIQNGEDAARIRNLIALSMKTFTESDGHSQVFLATKLRISPQYLGDLIKGRRKLSLDLAKKIVEME